ncbi:hypothetical protein [Streptomyces sp. NPDC006638]|uniref:nuclear transport factor 2 family protein n=1 Tax=Streptomyces sp. NPDC006638 TaxID=3157183 RepID=UPI0033AAA2F4
MMSRVGRALPNGVRVEITSVTSEGERVVIEYAAHDESAVGKVYDNRITLAVELSGGKIIRVREYLDTIHANDVLVLE